MVLLIGCRRNGCRAAWFGMTRWMKSVMGFVWVVIEEPYLRDHAVIGGERCRARNRSHAADMRRSSSSRSGES